MCYTVCNISPCVLYSWVKVVYPIVAVMVFFMGINNTITSLLFCLKLKQCQHFLLGKCMLATEQTHSCSNGGCLTSIFPLGHLKGVCQSQFLPSYMQKCVSISEPVFYDNLRSNIVNGKCLWGSSREFYWTVQEIIYRTCNMCFINSFNG